MVFSGELRQYLMPKITLTCSGDERTDNVVEYEMRADITEKAVRQVTGVSSKQRRSKQRKKISLRREFDDPVMRRLEELATGVPDAAHIIADDINSINSTNVPSAYKEACKAKDVIPVSCFIKQLRLGMQCVNLRYYILGGAAVEPLLQQVSCILIY